MQKMKILLRCNKADGNQFLTTSRNTQNRISERIKTAANSTFAIGGVSCFADNFEVTESFAFRINICGENRHLRQAANR